jgi:iron complex transport system substrate-binding protein
MQARIDAVTAAVAGKEAPTVYYATGFGEYGDYTAGGDTFIHQLITLAGGRQHCQGCVRLGITNEAIFEADPQIILVGTGMKELLWPIRFMRA